MNDKITLGLIASWGFGGFFMLGGIIGLLEDPMLGICAISASALLLPPARDFVHQKTNKSLSSGVRFVAVITLLGIGGAASSNSDLSSTGSSSSGDILASLSKIDDRGLNVSDLELARGQYGVKTVTGILENTNNKEYSYVQVEINLYDKDGVQVGSTLANANNLEANGKWRFQAPVLENNVATAKLKEITAF